MCKDGWKSNVVSFSTAPYIFSSLRGTSSSSSMMLFQHITSKVFVFNRAWDVFRGQIEPAPERFQHFSLNPVCRPGKICSSSHIWQPSSTTTACTWRITCSRWATVSKLTCRSPTVRASPHLSTWCQASGGWVNEDLMS